MQKELKHPTTYMQQIKILESKGLIVEDEARALAVLSNANYYRIINAYSIGLLHDDKYQDRTTFGQIYQLYSFDTRFRNIISEIIENIEIMLRTKIAYHLSHKYCNVSYMREELFSDKGKFDKFIDTFNREKSRQQSTDIMEHYNFIYDGILPIWVGVEFFSFGTLSKFFKNMLPEDKKEIIKSLPHTEQNKYPTYYLDNWLQALVDVRNICAHYGRLYNRNLPTPVNLFREHKFLRNNRIYSVLLVAKRLFHNETKWNSFIVDVQALLGEYSSVRPSWLGFPYKKSDAVSKDPFWMTLLKY